MPDQLLIGNNFQGQKTYLPPFKIDNDAFPLLYNAYSWRGRIKRKRGTSLLGQLQRQIDSVAVPDFTIKPWLFGPLALVAGAGNLITGPWQTNTNASYSLEATSTIVPGSINVTVGANTYTEPANPDGTLIGTPAGTGTINYATGAINISGGGVGPLTGTFSYYPGLPVLGLADFQINQSEVTNPLTSALFPILLAFDQKYSYQINQALTPASFYNTTFYKTTGNPFTWSGEDFQQFWTTNYSGALWATNNKPGFNFKLLGNGNPSTIFQISATVAGVNLTAHGLIVGDLIFINEVTGTIATGSGNTQNQNVNGQTGRVTTIINADAFNAIFDGNLGTTLANFQAGATGTGGIAQYLTNTIPGQDGIKWYDGDPTNADGIPPNVATGKGWVNFSPPLTATSVSINNLTTATYYLVGALSILPFKDRLLFFSPWIQSSTGQAIQLIDTVLWSWNGTPYYAAVVPTNQTSNFKAYFVDQTGLGGYLSAGISQPIKTVSNNEDVLLIGFGGDGRKTRFVYSGNDLQPFLFFTINSELPSFSTFSSVALDRGAIDIGQYGIAITDQQSSQRIDLDIPDSVFQIQLENNGADRVNAIRNFFREWIYFSYPTNENISPFDTENNQWKFPTQTFLFNYRDNTWAILYENYTSHGYYRPQTLITWATLPYLEWTQWNSPWNSGSNSKLFTQVIAGNPQGYVLIQEEESTDESISGTISAISNNNNNLEITSTNHCVSINDFLYVTTLLDSTVDTITGVTLGTTTIIAVVNSFVVGQYVFIGNITGTSQLNGNVYKVLTTSGTQIEIDVDSTTFSNYVSGGTVQSATLGQIGKVVNTPDADHFVLDIAFPTNITYIGLGNFIRLSQPFIQTKQFPVYWQEGRKVRLGVQRYLFDTTADAQVTIDINLSQDSVNAWNDSTLPQVGTPNGLIYSQTVFTCPESTNLGLTPANVNLQMPLGNDQNQEQCWHRMNTSLIGDTVQLSITLNNDQMRNLDYATSEITLHAIQINLDRGPLLS